MVSNTSRPVGGSSVAFGGVLILLGILLLAEQLLGLNIGDFGWPLVVIAFGIAIFAGSLAGVGNEGTAIFGSMVTMVGLILFVQNAFELWATWAYAWTLVAPTSVGIGQMLFGLLKGQSHKASEGMNTTLAGLGMFLVFGAFFELALGLSGLELGRYGWPVLLIGLGALVFLKEMLAMRRSA